MHFYDLLLYGGITLVLSAIFSMGGSGSGNALIPVLSFLGLDFLYAKAYGLFAGLTTTVTSSVMNIKRVSTYCYCNVAFCSYWNIP